MNTQSERILRAIGTIDDDIIAEAKAHLKKESQAITVALSQTTFVPTKPIRFISVQFAGLIAAMLIITIGAGVMFHVFPSAPDLPPFPPDSIDYGVHRGLLTRDIRFQYSDGLWTADGSFPDMFAPNVQRQIAVVQARDISFGENTFNEKHDEETEEVTIRYQHMTLQVLENIHSATPDQTFEYRQYESPDGNTDHWLREGGIYIVPLFVCGGCDGEVSPQCIALFSSRASCFEVQNIHAVLFEIDSNGTVYSHSQHSSMSFFDGKAYTFLIDEINRLHSNDEFVKAALSGLSMRFLKNENPLLEVVVTDVALCTEHGFGENITVDVTRRVHVSESLPLPVPDTITFWDYLGQDREDITRTSEFEVGERYLAFFFASNFHSGRSYDMSTRVRIGAGDVLEHDELDYDWSLFAYSGYTVDEIERLIERVVSFAATFEREL
jgi:hypothetical protein